MGHAAVKGARLVPKAVEEYSVCCPVVRCGMNEKYLKVDLTHSQKLTTFLSSLHLGAVLGAALGLSWGASRSIITASALPQ
jgi:uncharacterized metal-binding protein